MQLPVKTEEDFAQTLRDMYLSDPINSARLDVSFSQDNSRVEAARFLIQVSKDSFPQFVRWKITCSIVTIEAAILGYLFGIKY